MSKVLRIKMKTVEGTKMKENWKRRDNWRVLEMPSARCVSSRAPTLLCNRVNWYSRLKTQWWNNSSENKEHTFRIQKNENRCDTLCNSKTDNELFSQKQRKNTNWCKSTRMKIRTHSKFEIWDSWIVFLSTDIK